MTTNQANMVGARARRAAPAEGGATASARWILLAGAAGFAGAADLGTSFTALPAPPALTAPAG